ncbi:MAG: hypothetical protein RLZZ628_3245 [Bacteroidota bacterium]|jgi:hypothetical protein
MDSAYHLFVFNDFMVQMYMTIFNNAIGKAKKITFFFNIFIF